LGHVFWPVGGDNKLWITSVQTFLNSTLRLWSIGSSGANEARDPVMIARYADALMGFAAKTIAGAEAEPSNGQTSFGCLRLGCRSSPLYLPFLRRPLARTCFALARSVKDEAPNEPSHREHVRVL